MSLRKNSEGYAVPVFSRRRLWYCLPEKAPRATRFRYCPPDGGSGIVPSKKLRGLRGSSISAPARVKCFLLTWKRSSSYVSVLMLLLLVCLPKSSFFVFLIPPARDHCTGLPADPAYYTAALQLVAYLGGARRRN